METEETRGRPKKSTLQDLFKIAFDGIDRGTLVELLCNINNRVFRDGCVQEIYHQFRFNDIEILEAFRSWLQETLDETTEEVNPSRPSGWSGLEGLPSGLDSPEDAFGLSREP